MLQASWANFTKPHDKDLFRAQYWRNNLLGIWVKRGYFFYSKIKASELNYLQAVLSPNQPELKPAVLVYIIRHLHRLIKNGSAILSSVWFFPFLPFTTFSKGSKGMREGERKGECPHSMPVGIRTHTAADEWRFPLLLLYNSLEEKPRWKAPQWTVGSEWRQGGLTAILQF